MSYAKAYHKGPSFVDKIYMRLYNEKARMSNKDGQMTTWGVTVLIKQMHTYLSGRIPACACLDSSNQPRHTFGGLFTLLI